MKKEAVVLVFLLLLPFLLSLPMAVAEWQYSSKNLIIKIDINSDMEVIPLTSSGYVEKATVNLTFYPKEAEGQELLSLKTTPEATDTGKELVFEWSRPEGKINFNVNADVKTSNSVKKVKEKIPFPVENLPTEILGYINPTETIDSGNEDIIKLANKLVKGEDDLYEAVFKVAEWTKNNIRYNLSTLTAEVSQKSSWVLENKQGVCDELTSLFIAMLRAVGIPARFVSGIAYTDSDLFPENWGPHGWAEVYFPNYGWAPFDVTYGQFGWIDASHIKFKNSLDSDEPSTYYQWLGRNADIETKNLDIKASLTGKEGYAKIPLKLEASVLKSATNFGSHNLVEASIENLNDFYYSTEIYISRPREVKILGTETKAVLLKPLEKKKVAWVLKVDDTLDERYSYTFPITVSTLDNLTYKTSFVSNTREQRVSFQEVDEIAKLIEEEEQKEYSANVFLYCKTKEEFYEYEDVAAVCTAKNIGNVFLDDVDICFGGKCLKTTLGISQSRNFTFGLEKSVAGEVQNLFTAKNELVTKTHALKYTVIDEPEVVISKMIYPINVSYEDSFIVYFTLEKKSKSIPKDVYVVFEQNGVEKGWLIKELVDDKEFALRFQGSQLAYGKNANNINVVYHDGLDKNYEVNENFEIALTKASLLQRLISMPNRVNNQTLWYIALIIVLAAFMFIMVVIYLFKSKTKKIEEEEIEEEFEKEEKIEEKDIKELEKIDKEKQELKKLKDIARARWKKEQRKLKKRQVK